MKNTHLINTIEMLIKTEHSFKIDIDPDDATDHITIIVNNVYIKFTKAGELYTLNSTK